MRNRSWYAGICAAACAVLLAGEVYAAGNILQELQNAQETVIEQAQKAVVTINIRPKIDATIISGESEELFGSGNLLGEGYILTNRHVVDPLRIITPKMIEEEKVPYDYRVTLHDERSVPARLVHIADYTDLALIRVGRQPENVTIVRPASAAHAVLSGSIVFAIGSPHGFKQSVTSGIVSNPKRDMEEMGFKTHTLIQTDAAINRGNSGGPLINIYGEVVGINTVGYFTTGGNIGLGFAIPAEIAWEYVRTIREGGKTDGYIGIRVTPLDDEIRWLLSGLGDLPNEASSGLYVSDVEAKWRGTFMINDVIIHVEGRAIADPNALERTIASYGAGTTITVSLWRAGAILDIKVEVSARPTDK